MPVLVSNIIPLNGKNVTIEEMIQVLVENHAKLQETLALFQTYQTEFLAGLDAKTAAAKELDDQEMAKTTLEFLETQKSQIPHNINTLNAQIAANKIFQTFLEKVNLQNEKETAEEKLTRFEILAQELNLLPDFAEAKEIVVATKIYIEQIIKTLQETVMVARFISELQKAETDSMTRQNEAKVTFLKKQEAILQYKLERLLAEDLIGAENKARLIATVDNFKEKVKASHEQYLLARKLDKEKAIKGAISTHIELYIKQLTDSLQSVLSDTTFNNELKIIIKELNALCELSAITTTDLNAVFTSIETKCPGFHIQALFDKLFPMTETSYKVKTPNMKVPASDLMLAIDSMQDHAKTLIHGNDCKVKAYGVIANNLSKDLKNLAYEFHKDSHHLNDKNKIADFKRAFSKLLHCKDSVMSEHRATWHAAWRNVIEKIAKTLKAIGLIHSKNTRIFSFFGATTAREKYLQKINHEMEKSVLRK